MFKKKTTTIEESLNGIERKIHSLESKARETESNLRENATQVESVLEKISLAEEGKDGDFQAELKRLRVARGRMEESLNDSKFQLGHLHKRRSELLQEKTAAFIGESEPKLEEIAKRFNESLDLTIKTAEDLERQYTQLKGIEHDFNTLYQERQDALRKTHQVIPLNLKEGLGRLANAPSPYSHTFQIDPNDIGAFLNALLQYRKNLMNYESQKDKIKKNQPKQEEFSFKFALDRFIQT